MSYLEYRNLMDTVERFKRYVNCEELFCDECKQTAGFNPGGLYDEDYYECPVCGNVEKYYNYMPMCIDDFFCGERFRDVFEYSTTPQGLYIGARIKISDAPTVYIDTASRTCICESDGEFEYINLDIDGVCRKIDMYIAPMIPVPTAKEVRR